MTPSIHRNAWTVSSSASSASADNLSRVVDVVGSGSRSAQTAEVLQALPSHRNARTVPGDGGRYIPTTWPESLMPKA